MSAFATITTAVQALLMQSPALAGGRVWRGRIKPLAQEHDTAIVIRLMQSPSARVTVGGSVKWQTNIAIDCLARGTIGQDPEDAVDPLLAAVYARIVGAGSLAPGVVDTGADPLIEWDIAEADTALSCATLHLRVTHLTLSTSLTAWA